MATSTKLVVRYNDVLETIDVDPTLAIQNPLLLINNAFENNPAELSSAVVALNNFLKNKGSDIQIFADPGDKPWDDVYPLINTMRFSEETRDKLFELYRLDLEPITISQEVISVFGDASLSTSIKIMVSDRTLEIPLGDVLSLKSSINANIESSSGLLNVGGVGLPIRFEIYFLGEQEELLDASEQSTIPDNATAVIYFVYIDRITEDLSTSLEVYEPGGPIVVQVTGDPVAPLDRLDVYSFPSQIKAITKWYGPDMDPPPPPNPDGYVFVDNNTYSSYGLYVNHIVSNDSENSFAIVSNGGSYGTKTSLSDLMTQPLDVADRSLSSLSSPYLTITGTIGKLEIPKYSGSSIADDISTVLHPKEHQGDVRYYLNELLPYTMVFDAERNKYSRTNKIYPTPTEWGE